MPPERDYEGDMRAYLRRRVPKTDYVASIVADEAVTELEKTDPGLLHGWLTGRARPVITDLLHKWSVATRTTTRIQGPRTVFGQAAEAFAQTGDASVLRPLEAEYVINDDRVRRRVYDLTPEDCSYISAQYRKAAQTALLEAAFFRALRKRLVDAGATRVGDLFNAAEYDRMRRTFLENGNTAQTA